MLFTKQPFSFVYEQLRRFRNCIIFKVFAFMLNSQSLGFKIINITHSGSYSIQMVYIYLVKINPIICESFVLNEKIIDIHIALKTRLRSYRKTQSWRKVRQRLQSLLVILLLRFKLQSRPQETRKSRHEKNVQGIILNNYVYSE